MSRQFRRSSLDVRYGTSEDGVTQLDEVVAADDLESVHLEKMSDSVFCLIIETRTERLILNIGAARAAVNCDVFEREPVNRRSEAQRRRWAHLRTTKQVRRNRQQERKRA